MASPHSPAGLNQFATLQYDDATIPAVPLPATVMVRAWPGENEEASRGAHCRFLDPWSQAVDVEATGDRLGVDKLVAIGAVLLRIESPFEAVEVERRVWRFKVDYPADFEPDCVKNFWSHHADILRDVSSSDDSGTSLLWLRCMGPALHGPVLCPTACQGGVHNQFPRTTAANWSPRAPDRHHRLSRVVLGSVQPPCVWELLPGHRQPSLRRRIHQPVCVHFAAQTTPVQPRGAPAAGLRTAARAGIPATHRCSLHGVRPPNLHADRGQGTPPRLRPGTVGQCQGTHPQRAVCQLPRPQDAHAG